MNLSQSSSAQTKSVSSRDYKTRWTSTRRTEIILSSKRTEALEDLFRSHPEGKVFQIWKTSGLEDFQMTSRKSSRQLPGSLPDNFQEVIQTTSRKSSRQLPGSLLTEYSPMSSFHNRSERFVFSDLGLIYMFFRSGLDFRRLMGSLLGSLLKYNAPRRLPRILLTESSSISSGV
uniref:Uncharacterized protein n=1 Tax=Brassica oleracea var. oleracea TaxID=109376 RepID=A0A0D2ZSI3_BRAOL